MWPTIERARRRLLGGALDQVDEPAGSGPSVVAQSEAAGAAVSGADGAAEPAPADGATSLAVRPADVATSLAARHGAGTLDRETIVTLGRPDLDRLGAALVGLLGPATVRPDTPARLEHALVEAAAKLGRTARVTVERLPAGVTTPEAWQVHLCETDVDTIATIREAIRTGSFAR